MLSLESLKVFFSMGLGTPEPQCRTHHVAPPPPGLLGALSVIHGGSTGRSLQAPGDIRRPPVPKCLGPCSRSPMPSPRSTPPLAAQPVDRDCQPPGCYPNLWWAPEGPIPGSYCPNTGNLGILSPSARLTLLPYRHLDREGHRRSLREGEEAGPSKPPATFEGPLHQNARAHAPARQCPYLGPPLRLPHRWRIGPAGLLGANPNPRSTP